MVTHTRATFANGIFHYGGAGRSWRFGVSLRGNGLAGTNYLWRWAADDDAAVPKLHDDLHQWCIDNEVSYEMTVSAAGDFLQENTVLCFRAENDAMLFKLRWIGS